MTLLNGTMTAIETVSVASAGGTTGIQFNNIPQTYTDLVILLSCKTSRTQDNTVFEPLQLRFNGSTSGYRSKNLQGLPDTGYQVLSGSTTTETSMQIGQAPGTFGDTTSTFSNQMYYITNYRNATYKCVHADSVTEASRAATVLQIDAGIWDNTAAITSIEIFPRYRSPHAYATVLQQYSSATLYGVKSASVGAKATGGIISSDTNYWYHTFTTSGTFTPTQNLAAEYLVVAGGGGGGVVADSSLGSGGGGAGGYRTATGFSLTASTNYTVTIGAGGAGASYAVPNGGTASAGSNSVFSTITSSGGGRGATRYADRNTDGDGTAGGSGGGGRGGSTGTLAVGAGGSGNLGGYTPAEGYAGGNGYGDVPRMGGGGGGAAEAGNTDGAGHGGDGIDWNSLGTYYAGGGGGGQGSSTGGGGAGGLGGGGNGGGTNQNGFSGTANTGGGGGGGGNSNSGGGSGGSGVVIIRYAK